MLLLDEFRGYYYNYCSITELCVNLNIINYRGIQLRLPLCQIKKYLAYKIGMIKYFGGIGGTFVKHLIFCALHCGYGSISCHKYAICSVYVFMSSLSSSLQSSFGFHGYFLGYYYNSLVISSIIFSLSYYLRYFPEDNN